MSFPELLTVIGGFTVIFHLLRLAWRCWCGFREFVLSELWQVDLRTYGRWAGKLKNNIRYVLLQDGKIKTLTMSNICTVCVAPKAKTLI